MAIELMMPALSPTMEKANLARWLVEEGDLVKPGDLIAEIETDKATMELEAVDKGRIVSLIVPAGSEDVAIGTVIALLIELGEAAPEPILIDAATAKAASHIPRNSAPALGTAETISPQHQSEVTNVHARSISADQLRISPLVARIAKAKKISLDGIMGTGPNGRIVRADLGIRPIIEPQPVAASLSAASALSTTNSSPPAGVPFGTAKLSFTRKTIALRLTQAKQTVPHFYLTVRCNLDPLLKLRCELNADLHALGVKLSVNDMLMKAMALALVEVPEANVQFANDELYRFSRVDIAMAVAIDEGLITPIIKDVTALSLSAIAKSSKSLAAKAREGKLAPEDYQGGTASISNLGMFGIDEMLPIINPPQAIILGIGAGVQQPWNVNGEIALATVMAATASFDHRAVDGAVAAKFMAMFRKFLEAPLQLLT